MNWLIMIFGGIVIFQLGMIVSNLKSIERIVSYINDEIFTVKNMLENIKKENIGVHLIDVTTELESIKKDVQNIGAYVKLM